MDFGVWIVFWDFWLYLEKEKSNWIFWGFLITCVGHTVRWTKTSSRPKGLPPWSRGSDHHCGIIVTIIFFGWQLSLSDGNYDPRHHHNCHHHPSPPHRYTCVAAQESGHVPAKNQPDEVGWTKTQVIIIIIMIIIFLIVSVIIIIIVIYICICMFICIWICLSLYLLTAFFLLSGAALFLDLVVEEKTKKVKIFFQWWWTWWDKRNCKHSDDFLTLFCREKSKGETRRGQR